MSAKFFDIMKYAATGIASPYMTGFDKMLALSTDGSAVNSLTGVPPISFKGNGTPLISWSILGKTVQNGTPTPTSPIPFQGVGERTANLVDIPVYRKDINSPDTKTYSIYLPENTYVLSCEVLVHEGVSLGSAGAMYATINGTKRYIVPNSSSIDNFVKYSTSYTGEITEVGFVGYNYEARNPNSYVIIKNIQLELGSTATAYEPYGYKIQITSAGQTVPVYLGQTQTVRRVKKLVLTGDESWLATSGIMYLDTLSDDYMRASGVITCICTHYSAQGQVGSAIGVNAGCITLGSDSSFQRLYVYDTNISTVADFKSYLAAQYAAGTPVTAWYVLATPETAIVNEPLMKIGDYADELRSTDAGVSIPTAVGTNVLDTDTTVKPSSMSITGKIKPVT